MDTNTNLAGSLYRRLAEGGYQDKIVSPAAARELVTKKTLLAVLDTHVRSYLESDEIFAACRNVVVVDHHRKMVGHIDNAIIFYHEPYASSTSEMVTELIQYMAKCAPSSCTGTTNTPVFPASTGCAKMKDDHEG